MLLFPPADLRRPVILAAWAANAVCETVRKVTALQSRIKWPNDVLVRGRKICGILIEQKTGVRAQWPGAGVPASRVRKDQPGTSLAAQPDGLPPAPGSVPPDFAVAGIGLNVNQTVESLAEAGLPQAGSLAFFIGGPLDRWEVARQLIACLDEGYERLCRGDLATLEARWKRRTGLLGRHVLIESQERSYRGRLREIAWDGLVVELARGQTLRLQPEAVKHVTRLSGEW